MDELAFARQEAAKRYAARQRQVSDTDLAARLPVKPAAAPSDDPVDALQLASLSLWPSTRRSCKRLIKLNVPEGMLVLALSVTWRAWASAALWFYLFRASARHEHAQLFLLVSVLLLLSAGFSRKRKGDVSAYSLFNTAQKALPGAASAAALDAQLRSGQL